MQKTLIPMLMQHRPPTPQPNLQTLPIPPTRTRRTGPEHRGPATHVVVGRAGEVDQERPVGGIPRHGVRGGFVVVRAEEGGGWVVVDSDLGV